MQHIFFHAKIVKMLKLRNVGKLFAMKTCTMTTPSQIYFYSTCHNTIDFKGALQNMHVSFIYVFKYPLSKSEKK